MTEVVQWAFPEHASAVLADPVRPALRARLTEVAQPGENPADVLAVVAVVAARRKLTSAESVAEVLTWRCTDGEGSAGRWRPPPQRARTPRS